MAQNSQPLKKLRRFALWSALILSSLVLLLFLVFLFFSHLANTTTLPESLKKPPIDLPRSFLAPGSHSASGSAARSPIKLPLNEGMDEYLKLRLAQDPNLKSASLYMQLLQRLRENHEKYYFDEKINQLLYGLNGKTLSPEQSTWLRAQTDFFDLLHRFCLAEDLPVPTFEESQNAETVKYWPFLRDFDATPFRVFNRMLAERAEMLTNENDYTRARQTIQDAVLLTSKFLRTRPTFWNPLLDLQETLDLAEGWMAQPDFPPAELHPLAATLETFEHEFLTPEWVTDSYKGRYQLQRSFLVSKISGPTWREYTFGWTGLMSSQIQIWNGFYLPNPRDLAECTIISIHNRLNSAEALKEFDRQSLEALKLTKSSFAELDRLRFPYTTYNPFNDREFLIHCSPGGLPKEQVWVMSRFMYIYQARFHLLRLAADLREDLNTALAGRTAAATDPHNPWRDPYTSGLMQIDTTTSPTLVWSLGSDMTDQHGATISTTADGIAIPHDIAIRVSH